MALAVVALAGCQRAAPPSGVAPVASKPAAPTPAPTATVTPPPTATLYTCTFTDAAISRFEQGTRRPDRDASPMVLRYLDDPAGPRVSSEGGSGPLTPNRGNSAVSFFERSVAGTVAMTTIFPAQTTADGALAVLSRHVTREPYDEPLVTQAFGRCRVEKVVPGVNAAPD